MIIDGRVLGLPLTGYKDTKANIEALTAAEQWMTAYATDTDELGIYDGAAWHWVLDVADDLLNIAAIQFDLTYAGGHAEGLLHWNSDDGTLEVGMPGGDVTNQIGQELFVGRAKNNTGSTIPNGTVVYISGGTGSNPEITPADPDSITTAGAVGITTEELLAGQFGYVTAVGLVRDVDTSGFTAGDTLWLDDDGGITNTRPTSPRFQVVVGVCIRSHATEGVIFAKIDLVPRLQGLSDVYAGTMAEGDFPMWNNDNLRFEMSPLFPDALQQPTGFEKATGGAPPTDSVVTYDPATRVISIAPTGAEFHYWLRGKRYTVTSAQTPAAHANTTGVYFLYWDAANTLTFSTTPWSIFDDVPIAYVYYNATLADGFVFEERHGADRNKAWHYSDHFKRGTYWHTGEGLGISGYTLQPASPADSDNQWAIAVGEIHDEDIAFPNTGRTAGSYEVFYRLGATGAYTWLSNNVPLLAPVGGYVYWNENTGATWQLTEGDNGKYINYFVCATLSLDSDYDIFTIMGQEQHDNLADAEAETAADLDLSDLPFQEILFIYQVTFRTSASYSTEGECRIEALQDTRQTTERQVVSSSPAVNHNSLGGLQGGAAGEYYHLTLAQHGNLTGGSPAFDNVLINDGGYAGVAADVRIKFDATSGYIDLVLDDAAGADEVRVVDSGGVKVASTDSDGNGYYAGNVGIGTIAPIQLLDITNPSGNAAEIIAAYGGTASLLIYSPRGTLASPTATQDNDVLGQVVFQGWDTARSTGAAIKGEADAEWGTGGSATDNPSRLTFWTIPDGSNTLTERLRITMDGNVLIGHTTDNGYRLDIDDGAQRFAEKSAPSASPNAVVAHAVDNGGVTEFRVMLPSGTPVVLARDGGLATYTPTNVTTDRAFDANTVAIAELADVLGTLINDLQAAGVLG